MSNRADGNANWRLVPPRSTRGAQDIPAGQVKVSVGGEGGTADLRRRGSLEDSQALLEARGAIVGGRLEPQDGGKGTAMNDALARVAARLEAQRVDVRTPNTRHAGARDPVVTSLRNIAADATPNTSQNTTLATVVATRNWLCNCAGASDDSTAGWGAETK